MLTLCTFFDPTLYFGLDKHIQENLEQSRELSRTFAAIADILEGMIPADGETDIVEEAA